MASWPELFPVLLLVLAGAARGSWEQDVVSDERSGSLWGVRFWDPPVLSGDGTTAVVTGLDEGAEAWIVSVQRRDANGTLHEEGRLALPSSVVGFSGPDFDDWFRGQALRVSLSEDGASALLLASVTVLGRADRRYPRGWVLSFERTCWGLWTFRGTLWPVEGSVNPESAGVGTGAVSADGLAAAFGAFRHPSGSREVPVEYLARVLTRPSADAEWEVAAEVHAPDRAAGAGFCSLAALSAGGTTLLCSDEGGAALSVFARQTTGAWELQGRLDTPSRDVGLQVALSADGGVALVGAPHAGTVRVFSRDARSAWSAGPVLANTGAASPGSFGAAVVVSADGAWAAVGAPGDDLGAGAVHLFRGGPGLPWEPSGVLRPSNASGAGHAAAGFGAALAATRDLSTVLVTESGSRHTSRSARERVLWLPCPAGELPGRPCPSVQCPAGFFCGGSLAPAAAPCPPGFFCPPGSAAPVPCGPGRCSPSRAGSEAACGPCPPGASFGPCGPVCPGGAYCPGGSPLPLTCGAGVYCPAGSESNGAVCPGGLACPAGLGPVVCGPGRSCPPGSVSALALCSAGYFCANGSAPAPCPAGRSCPPGTSDASAPCPVFFFCPGAAAQQLCRAGRFCPAGSQDDSAPCPAGSLCSPGHSSMPYPQPCPAGSYCPQGTDQARACPAGSYCPVASAEPSPCAPGRWCQAGSRDGRAPCRAGWYCEAGSAPQPCAAGRVCLEGSPSGTVPCPGGTLCPGGGVPPGPCPAGAFCPTGSAVAFECPVGSYCPEGSAAATPCPGGAPSPPRSAGVESCGPQAVAPQATALVTACLLAPVALLSVLGAAFCSPSLAVSVLVLVEAGGVLSSVAFVLRERFVASWVSGLATALAALPAAARLAARHPTREGLAAGTVWARSSGCGSLSVVLFGFVVYPLVYLVCGLAAELLLYASAMGALPLCASRSPWWPWRRGGQPEEKRPQAAEQEARAAAVAQLLAQALAAPPALAVQVYNCSGEGRDWSAAALVSATLSCAVMSAALWAICEPRISARLKRRLMYESVAARGDAAVDVGADGGDGDEIALAEVSESVGGESAASGSAES